MNPAESLQPVRRPAYEAIGSAKRLHDPGIDRKTFPSAETEQGDASRDLGPDPGKARNSVKSAGVDNAANSASHRGRAHKRSAVPRRNAAR